MNYLDKSLKEIHEALKTGKVTSNELIKELKKIDISKAMINNNILMTFSLIFLLVIVFISLQFAFLF